MPTEPNPYAPPPEADPARLVLAVGALPEEPVAQYTLRGGNPRGEWELAFGAERMYLSAPAGGPRLALSRADFLEHADVVPTARGGMLIVRAPQRLAAPLTLEARASLRRWLDPVLGEHLARALRKRLRFGVPIGLFVVLSSLPGLGGARTDVGGLAFGAGLALVAVLSGRVRHRGVLLGHAAVWVLFAANNAARVARGEGKWQLIFALLGVLFVAGALRAYAFYKPLDAPRA